MRLDLQGVWQEPAVFGSCRGTLHLQTRSRVRAAVLLCPPLGRDAQSAYRPLWLAAQEMAARGFAVLRYDHPGAGDSAPLPPGADAWPHWVRAAIEGARFIRARTGAPRLVIAGLRIGATIGAFASEEAGADALALWAPVVAGRAWLRQLRFAASILDPHRLEDDGGGLEAGGLSLSPATVRSLERVRLDPAAAPAPRILIGASGNAPDLSARRGPPGPHVTTVGFDGAGELFQESYVNAPPLGLFRATLAWLEEVAGDWPAVPLPAGSPPATLRLAEAEEQAVVFGDGLRGVLCVPRRPAPGGRAVLFPNTGGDPRAGNGGFAAWAARRLAAEGVASLRFDFAGLGESDFAQDWRSHVYETSRIADFRAAADLLAGRGYDDLVVTGVCSGAYHGVRAAMAEPRIRGVLAVNPALWARRTGAPLVAPDRNEVAASRILARRLARLLLRPGALARGSAERAECAAAAAALRDRVLMNLADAWRYRADTRRLRRELAELARRGGRLRLLIGLTDIALDRVELHFGRRGAWLRRHGFETDFSPDLDHGLALADSQQQVLNALLEFCAVPASARDAAATQDPVLSPRTSGRREPAPAPG